MAEIRCNVNGVGRTLNVLPMARLLDVLREQLRLTGVKEGCGEGECGACSVLIGGELANSCLVPALHADGEHITTIEGIAIDGKLDRVQQAFIEFGGAQCGICTPGMIMAAVALGKKPSLDAIRAGLAGNLCRCTGYSAIYRSIQSV